MQEDVTVSGPVSRMRGSPSHAKLAFGGKENELAVFDLESRKVHVDRCEVELVTE